MPNLIALASPVFFEAQEKYDVPASVGARVYATFGFACASVAVFAVLQLGDRLGAVGLVWVAVSCYLTLMAIGGALESRQWLKWLEPVRYVLLFLLVPVLEW